MSAMTYEDHVKAIAVAFDADVQAALAEHEAALRRQETAKALGSAKRDLDLFVAGAVVEETKVDLKPLNVAWREGRTEFVMPSL